MTMVERVGEELARQLNRRQTLKRAAVAVFGVVAAWTVEGFRGKSALAQQCGFVTEDNCTCTPPEGVYCSGLDVVLRRLGLLRRLLLRRVVSLRRRLLVQRHLSYDGGESGYYQLRLQLLRTAVRLPGVHLDRLQRTRPEAAPAGGPPDAA